MPDTMPTNEPQIDPNAPQDGQALQGSIDHWEPLLAILDEQNGEALAAFMQLMDPPDIPYTIGRMDEDARTKLFDLLGRTDATLAATVMEHFVDEQVADFIDDLHPEIAAAIVEEMDSADQADVLGEMDEKIAEAILAQMDPEDAADAEILMGYEDETAGGLMIDEVLSVHEDFTVAQAIDALRARAEEIEDDDYEVRYLYVLDAEEKLRGVVPMKRLLLAKPQRLIARMMIDEMETVQVSTTLDELEHIFDHVGYNAVPVTDRMGKLMGAVQRYAVQEALAEQGDEDLAKAGGIVGGEELRSMPPIVRAMRRLMFLAPIGLLMVVSTSVIVLFSDTIQKVPAVASLLPLVGGLCGSGGGQAVAVSMRELSLGLIKPKDAWYVMQKELTVSAINGLLLGLMLFVFVYFKTHQWHMGAVAGLAMVVVLPVAVCIGGCVPILLKRFRMDPAMLSVPAVTTVVDMTAFTTVLLLTMWLVL